MATAAVAATDHGLLLAGEWVETGEWDYPGAMAIQEDGFMYVVSSYRIFKVDPKDGSVISGRSRRSRPRSR